MERVFITGRGIVSPLGDTLEDNYQALLSGKSGIGTPQDFVDVQLPSQVGGIPNYTPDCGDLVDRKMARFCPPTGIMSIAAVRDMFREAGLSVDDVRGKRIAMVGGQAGTNYKEVADSVAAYRNSNFKLRMVTPFIVPRVMPSAAVSDVSLVFGLKGETYDVSAACSSSALSIVLATRLVRSGMYDMVVAGGAEILDWVWALGFSACRALSHSYNDTPERASRPFDADRDGFVLAGGAAYVLLESESGMKKRGATPICEVSGIAANSNATDMTVPDAASSADVIAEAIRDAKLLPADIGYVNTHGTGTIIGDPVELEAIRSVLGSRPAINSTKSQTGHMVGATGAAEIIFTSLMLERNFISASINIDHIDPKCSGSDIVTELRTGTDIKHALSNSFAFGGSNAALVLSKMR